MSVVLVDEETIGRGVDLAEVAADLAVPTVWVSTVDRLTRWIGHADDWESDDMGACASVVELTDTERVLYAIASEIDWQRAGELGSVLTGEDVPGPWCFVRNDDCGFWDATMCGTEDEAREYLADWVRENVPPTCDECGDEFDPDEGEIVGDLQAFCPDCWRLMGEEAATADTTRGRGISPGDVLADADGDWYVYRGTVPDEEPETYAVQRWAGELMGADVGAGEMLYIVGETLHKVR